MQQFHHILFATHGLEDDHKAMKQALSLAHSNQAQLKILLVSPEFPAALAAYKETYQQAILSNIQKSIHTSQHELEIDQNSQAITIEFETMSPYSVSIIQRVIRDGHDLLIKAVEASNHIAGFKALDMELVRKCPCPVWLYRTTSTSIKNARIAVAIDPESEELAGHRFAVQLLKMAIELTHSLSGELTVISCWDYPLENTLRNSPFIGIPEEHVQEIVHEKNINNRQALDKIIAEGQVNIPLQIQHQRGVPDVLIPQLIKQLNIDILVMGTVGRAGIPGFIIGNTAENVLQKVSCSLLALKPSGFISPVKV